MELNVNVATFIVANIDCPKVMNVNLIINNTPEMKIRKNWNKLKLKSVKLKKWNLKNKSDEIMSILIFQMLYYCKID